MTDKDIARLRELYDETLIRHKNPNEAIQSVMAFMDAIHNALPRMLDELARQQSLKFYCGNCEAHTAADNGTGDIVCKDCHFVVVTYEVI